MRFPLYLLACLLSVSGWCESTVIRPKVAFSATAVSEIGPMRIAERIHYADGRLRIDRGGGFASTILDVVTWTQCELMPDRTYLVLPLDRALFERFFAAPTAENGARAGGHARMDGMAATKFMFGAVGGTNPEGVYWLSDSGILLRRDYIDGVFGHSVHHVEYLKDITTGPQPEAMFGIPVGFRLAR